MRFDAVILAQKLRRILTFIFDNEVDNLSQYELAVAIEKSAFEEFSYFYLDRSKKVQKGYSTAENIIKYVKLCISMNCMDEKFDPIIEWNIVNIERAFYDYLSDIAKSKLLGYGIGVTKISDASSKILKEGNNRLPTIPEIYAELRPSISKRLFSQLIRLYTLSSTSLYDFKTKSLVLPRGYID